MVFLLCSETTYFIVFLLLSKMSLLSYLCVCVVGCFTIFLYHQLHLLNFPIFHCLFWFSLLFCCCSSFWGVMLLLCYCCWFDFVVFMLLLVSNLLLLLFLCCFLFCYETTCLLVFNVDK